MLRYLVIALFISLSLGCYAQSVKTDTLKMIYIPRAIDSTLVFGIIVVNITVDRNGDVTETSFDKSKTTITNEAVIEKYVKAAMKVKASPDPKAPEFRHGKITYKLSAN